MKLQDFWFNGKIVLKSYETVDPDESYDYKYDLDLNGSWNKENMHHSGRHPNAYHDYMLNEVEKIDFKAAGNQTIFLNEFFKLKNKVSNTPEMLRKSFWG